MYNLLRCARFCCVYDGLLVTSYILLLSVSAGAATTMFIVHCAPTTMFNHGEALMSSSNGPYCCSGFGDDDDDGFDDFDADVDDDDYDVDDVDYDDDVDFPTWHCAV